MRREPLSVAVCEDTPEDAKKLLGILERAEIPNRCTLFTSGEAFLRAYRAGDYDLLFSDIYMDGLSGVETVARLREMGDGIPTAFVTTSAEHALEGYRLSVMKYLEKPFCEKDVGETLKLALLRKNAAPSLAFSRNGREEKIPYGAIVYLEQQAHEIDVHLRDGGVSSLRGKLSDFAGELKAQGFVSLHKSFFVNPAFVCRIDSELRCFVMRGGKNVPIRRENMGAAKRAFESFLFERTRGLSE